jgi:hypothetical protein
MFKRKYTVTLLNSKWGIVKRNVNFTIIPRKDEYVYLDEQYYEVVNVVHMLNKKQDIFVIINEVENKIQIKNIDIQ